MSEAGFGADVRMRGFAERRDVEEVLALLAGSTSELEGERVPVTDCAGRVLAQAVTSPLDVPGFDRSAMDGYAVRGEQTFGASSYDPVVLELVGESLPGRASSVRVGPGQCVRIMTGAPLPEGADSVVMVEACSEQGSQVLVREAVPPGKHVGVRGEDIAAGETVLAEGRRLRPQDAGLLASIGVAPICVRRPRVLLLTTGDELVAPGEQPSGHRIVDSNSVVLQALVARDGGLVAEVERVRDREQDLAEIMQKKGYEVLLVSGGSSVGKEDHAPRLLAELGRLDFHGVTMRPSSPAGGGRIGDAAVFLLPGNPVSCLCAYEFFAGPTIRALGGRPRRWPHRRLQAPLALKIASQVGRTDYVRVALNKGRVLPLATSGASILSSTVRAAGAVVVPRELEGHREGEVVEVFLYDGDDG
jgi:molybdopterin molybdotransferase